jgi:hypothetical protein
MKTTKALYTACIIGTCLCASNMTFGADSCTGYDVLVTSSAETLEVGKGHTLTVFRSESILISENSIYHLATGECSGTALATPDGKVRVSGHCARRDKDGDTQSIEFSQAAGADKGAWKSTGGTGKFAGRADSGWFQDVRTDGKMAVSTWGGTCK